MKKLIAGILALTLVCSAAVLPAAKELVPGVSVTASAETISYVLTLTADKTISGDLITTNNVNLNGHTLTVTGDFHMTAGTLTLGGGTLNVGGGFYFEGVGDRASTDVKSKAILNMTNANDVINVGGDFVWDMNSTASTSSTKMTKGVINISGGFYDYTTTSTQSFRPLASSSLVVNFKGSGAKTIQPGYYSWFPKFSVSSDCGTLNVVDYFAVQSLQSNVTINTSNVSTGMLKLNGYNLTVNGSLTQDSNITLSGGTLKVTGDIIAATGTTTVDSGTIDVGGSYYVKSLASSGGRIVDADSTNVIVMNNASGNIKVAGDFFYWSHGDTAGTFSAGTITIGGNFTDKGTTNNSRFYATGSHTVYLNGAYVQTVSFAGTGRFYNLKLLYKKADYTLPSTTCYVNLTEGSTSRTSTSTIKGDVNGDGKINFKDVVLLARYINNNSTTILTSNADFDSNGTINSKDTVALAKSIL
ncbi:MAG: dockerin type I repeat-containing protein [Ruminococcus sp.]|nr:dockerin type I repeat-containing protein [Ruminococcus sp.]